MKTIRKDIFELYIETKLEKVQADIEFYEKRQPEYNEHLAYWQGVKSELESIRTAFDKSLPEYEEMLNNL